MEEDLNAEAIVSKLSDEDKHKKIQAFNKECLAILISFSIVLVLAISCVVLFSIFKVQTSGIVFAIMFIIVSIVAIVKSSCDISLKDGKKIIHIVAMEEKQRMSEEQLEEEWRAIEEQKLMDETIKRYHADDNNISYATIIDAYTIKTNKLHAILNYNEIIQTRYYKFKVVYYDGSSVIETCEEDSKRYRFLVSLVDNKPAEPVKLEKTNAEKLREYKQLMDDGIITKEEFEKKKDELLWK